MIRIIVSASINMIIIQKKTIYSRFKGNGRILFGIWIGLQKYGNVLVYTSFDEYEEDVEECLERLKEQKAPN